MAANIGTVTIPTTSIDAFNEVASTLCHKKIAQLEDTLAQSKNGIEEKQAIADAATRAYTREQTRLERTEMIMGAQRTRLQELRQAVAKRQTKVDAILSSLSSANNELATRATTASDAEEQLRALRNDDSKLTSFQNILLEDSLTLIDPAYPVTYEERTTDNDLERRLTVYLKDLKLRDEYGGFYDLNFGDFKFTLIFNEAISNRAQRVHMQCTSLGNHPYPNGPFLPHVNNEVCCLGNAPLHLIAAMRVPDVKDAIRVIVEYARGYSRSRGPYHKLYEWIPGNPQDVAQDGRHVISTTWTRNLRGNNDGTRRRRRPSSVRASSEHETTCPHCRRSYVYCRCDVCISCGTLLTDATRSDCDCCSTCCSLTHAYVPELRGTGINNSNCMHKAAASFYKTAYPNGHVLPSNTQEEATVEEAASTEVAVLVEPLRTRPAPVQVRERVSTSPTSRVDHLVDPDLPYSVTFASASTAPTSMSNVFNTTGAYVE